MPKAKTGSVPGTSSKAVDPAVKTDAAKAETGFLKAQDIIQMMVRHNCEKNAVDGFNPNVVYAVLVLDRFNFVNEYSTFERSYLISSSSPHFIARKGGWADQKVDYQGRPISPEIYGDCLDKTLDQGVRLDWYTWVYEGGYFYDPHTGAMLQYDPQTKSVKALPKKKAEITPQLIHETLLGSRLGPKYREMLTGHKALIEQNLTVLVEALKGEKGEKELTFQALEVILNGLERRIEAAKAEAKSAKAAEEAAEAKAESALSVESLQKALAKKYAKRLAALPGDEAVKTLVRKVMEALLSGWESMGVKKIGPIQLEEAILIIEKNVQEKIVAKRAAEAEKAETAKAKPKTESKPKAEKKPEPKPEVPTDEGKAKAKGPIKTERAKSAKGKAASFPVPVKRGKK